jgi:hypothetical protein
MDCNRKKVEYIDVEDDDAETEPLGGCVGCSCRLFSVEPLSSFEECDSDDALQEAEVDDSCSPVAEYEGIALCGSSGGAMRSAAAEAEVSPLEAARLIEPALGRFASSF